MSGLHLETPAQERFARDVLAWGQERPTWPPALVEGLRSRLDAGLDALGTALRTAAASRRGGTLSIGRRVLSRRVCDGWQLDPEPFRYGWPNVRASLARDAVAADWERDRRGTTREVVAAVWHEAASRQPGDPSSRSAWLNRRTAEEALELQAEVADLLEDVREVWPQLPAPAVACVVRRPIEVALAGGLVTLYGVPDLVVDSPLRDDRARALVVDLRTGLPRPEQDREALRFHALLVTLARGRPPFRWASYHVTEGRTEAEDLSPDVLIAGAEGVIEVVGQLCRLAAVGDGDQDPAVRLVAGRWCADCRRREACEVAARAAEADPAMSHPSGTMGA